MRTVFELTDNELEELRDTYFHQLLDIDKEVLEGMYSPKDIPMYTVLYHYADIDFSEWGFFCSQ